MRSSFRRLIVLAVCAAAPLVSLAAQSPQAPAKPVNVSGKWIMSLELEMGTATPALVLKQDGEKITGTYTGRYGTFALTGTLKERAISFGFKMNADGTEVNMSFAGEVAADAETMKGRAELEGLGEAAWTARRDKSGGD